MTRTRHHLAGWFVVVAALACVPASARADDRGDAEALFRAGEKAFAATQYASAADAFDQAYAKVPLPAIAFSAAQAHRLQYFVDNEPQHLARAAELYRIYIDQQKTGGRVADAVTALADIEPLLRQLGGSAMTPILPKAKATRLVVISDVAGARATIDGDGGPVPFVHEVAVGPHTVTIAADGYATLTRSATAIDGEMVPVEGELVPLPATISVPHLAHAEVHVDGRAIGEAPLPAIEVAAGRHFVAITRRGSQPFTRDVELARGGTVVLDPELHRTRQRKLVPWVVGVGGALAIGSGVAALLAHSSHSDALSLRGELEVGGQAPSVVTAYNNALAARTERLHATEWLGGAAGVVLASAALLYWFDMPSAAAETPPPVAPIVGASSVGVAIGGKF